MRLFALCLIGASSLLSSASPWAELVLQAPQAVGLIQKVRLVVEDNVTGGCWTNVEHVRQIVRLKLEQSGIAVEDDIAAFDPREATVLVDAYGSRQAGLCTAAASFTVRRGEVAVRGGVHIALFVDLASRDAFAAGRSLNNQMVTIMDQFVTEFAANVLEARRDPAVIAALESFEQSGIDWK